MDTKNLRQLNRNCFNFKNCKQVVRVIGTEVRDPLTSKWIKPLLEGPWICPDCRQQPQLLKMARRIMPAKLGMVIKPISLMLGWLLLVSCAGATGNPVASDPSERGLSYIAAAILTAAIIRAICNK